MAVTTIRAFIRRESFIEKLVLSKVFWTLSFIFLFGYPILRTISRDLPPPPSVMHQLPEYSLTNEFGKPFGSKDLQGKTYIANFMFTSCTSTCPKLMQQMQTVQKRVKGLGTKIAIVTFTVDPVTDTPKVLFKHARKLQTNPFVWNFLTGDLAKIENILLQGFKVGIGEKQIVATDVYDIAHSEKLVLVDGNGAVRGYYSSDKDGINMLMIDVGLLVNTTI